MLNLFFGSVSRHALMVAACGAIWFVAGPSPAKSQCLTQTDVQQMVQGLNTGPAAAINGKLRRELLEMKKKVLAQIRNTNLQSQEMESLSRGSANILSRTENLDKTLEQKREQNAARLCEMLKTYGFMGRSLVGDDGVAASFYLFKQFAPIELQIRMLPAIKAAVEKNELPKNDDYAAFVDRLRIGAGLKQMFGTQASIRGDFLVLQPIDVESQVDARRALYNMSPLENYIKYLETLYRMPLIRDRSQGPPVLKPTKAANSQLAESLQIIVPPGSDDEVIRVESELVSLNVNVLSKDPKARTSDLTASDLSVFEDGHEEQITFFAKADTPFDLILLLDLSGSSQDQLGLIRKASRRFIETARPSDRVGIITFSDKIKVVAPLTADREVLFKSIDKIDDIGYSYVWDGLLFALQHGFADKPPGRRRAVVMMSDGVDNALTAGSRGSATSFAKLIEEVRTGDAIVIPINLDTRDDVHCGSCDKERTARLAGNTLSVLAEESGGQVYYAKKIGDLEGVYESVLEDLSTIYSIGYEPLNIVRDGGWRKLKVEVRGHAGLTAHTRKGYYAKK